MNHTARPSHAPQPTRITGQHASRPTHGRHMHVTADTHDTAQPTHAWNGRHTHGTVRPTHAWRGRHTHDTVDTRHSTADTRAARPTHAPQPTQIHSTADIRTARLSHAPHLTHIRPGRRTHKRTNGGNKHKRSKHGKPPTLVQA